MLALISSALSFLGSFFGFGSKIADASAANASEASGVIAQVAADEKKSLAVESAELAASVSTPAAPSTLDAMKAGTF